MKLLEINSKLKLAMLLSTLLWASAASAQASAENSPEVSAVKSADYTDLNWGPCPPFMPEGCAIAVLHGNPAEPNSDILFKVEPNTDIPDHWHTSSERMLLVSGEMEITYEGEQSQTMSAGSYAYGPPEKPHTAKCGDAGPCVLYIAFSEPVDAFPTESKE